MSLAWNRYLDTVLFHEGLDLRLDGGRLGGFVAFDLHGGLNSLADLFIQAGSNLHLLSPNK